MFKERQTLLVLVNDAAALFAREVIWRSSKVFSKHAIIVMVTLERMRQRSCAQWTNGSFDYKSAESVPARGV